MVFHPYGFPSVRAYGLKIPITEESVFYFYTTVSVYPHNNNAFIIIFIIYYYLFTYCLSLFSIFYYKKNRQCSVFLRVILLLLLLLWCVLSDASYITLYILTISVSPLVSPIPPLSKTVTAANTTAASHAPTLLSIPYTWSTPHPYDDSATYTSQYVNDHSATYTSQHVNDDSATYSDVLRCGRYWFERYIRLEQSNSMR